MTTSIFARDMWPIWNFGDPNLRYESFLSTAKPCFQNFIDSLILYDEIIIPTDDFMSLAVLVGVLGVRPVVDLLDAEVVRMVRIKGALSYIGNGGGLLPFSIKRPNEGPLPVFLPAEEAIDWALSGLNNVRKIEVNMLTERVIKTLRETNFEDEGEAFQEQTYADVSGSQYLRKQFDLSGNLSNLSGIESTGVRIYGGLGNDENDDDQISSLLKLAHTNLEMRLADLAECSDFTTASPIGHLLQGKQERLRQQNIQHGKIQIKELAQIPDLGSWFLENSNDLAKLLELRNSNAGIEFRRWFHKNIGEEGSDFVNAYNELLQEKSTLQCKTSRTLRILMTAGWSYIEPVSGTAATIADNLLLDSFLGRKSPKFFLQSLTQLPTK